MFVVILRFSENRAQAAQYMAGHNEWIKRGFDDGVFMLSGSIQPGLGGAVFARNTTLHDLQVRVNDDPFVAEKVVRAEILEITPSRTDERFRTILGL